MRTDELLALLGRPATDKELTGYFSKNGINITQEVKLKAGDYSTYLERKEDGYSLVFTDEGMFLNKPKQQFGEGSLYFSGVFFYAEGKDGYSQYQEDILHKIMFSDTRGDLLKKLGEPSWQRKRRDGAIAADRWDQLDSSGKRIHITYFKDRQFPVVISIGIPDKE